MERLIDLDPQKEFTFIVSDAASAKTELHITNLVADNLAFKIKTTVPKYYVVKPNTGIISGNGDLTISITLTPIPTSVKDHKFMLQVARTSLASDELDAEALNTFWNNVKQMDKDAKEDHKLKVVLQSPDYSQSNNIAPVKSTETAVKTQPVAGSSAAFPNTKADEETKEREKEKESKKDKYQSALESNDKDEISEWNDKIGKLEKKHEELTSEVADKENELKELKEKETSDDNKTFKGNRSGTSGSDSKFGANRKPRGPGKTSSGSQFHMMHLLIAIIGGLAIGIIVGKIFFAAATKEN